MSQRIPSLHIKESDLITILREVLPNLPSKDWKRLSLSILDKGKSYNVASRSIRVTNDKLEKKVIKLKLAGRSDTAVFAQLLLLLRRQMKHRGITLIRAGDKDWLNLKEACKLATEFCNEFGFDTKTGYKKYIQMGLTKMKNFSIFKFKGLHAAICNEYEAIQVIERDLTPSETEECHDIYLANISERTGFAQGYKDIPDKYQYFVKAKEEAKRFGVSIRHYIAAQFYGFEWANVIPDPAQLVGTKSVDRLSKYAYQHNIQIGKKRNVVNFKSIRSDRNRGKQ